jgi:hypothetical protein
MSDTIRVVEPHGQMIRFGLALTLAIDANLVHFFQERQECSSTL